MPALACTLQAVRAANCDSAISLSLSLGSLSLALFLSAPLPFAPTAVNSLPSSFTNSFQGYSPAPHIVAAPFSVDKLERAAVAAGA